MHIEPLRGTLAAVQGSAVSGRDAVSALIGIRGDLASIGLDTASDEAYSLIGTCKAEFDALLGDHLVRHGRALLAAVQTGPELDPADLPRLLEFRALSRAVELDPAHIWPRLGVTEDACAALIAQHCLAAAIAAAEAGETAGARRHLRTGLAELATAPESLLVLTIRVTLEGALQNLGRGPRIAAAPAAASLPASQPPRQRVAHAAP